MRKVYVDGVDAKIIAERVEYLDENGKLVTESLRDFTKAALKKRFASLDDFLKRWKSAARKEAIVEELKAEGLPLEPIAEELGKRASLRFVMNGEQRRDKVTLASKGHGSSATKSGIEFAHG
jgi:type I site-specific restriction endonuclease